MRPNSPRQTIVAAWHPNCVASTRSKGVGTPPRWT
jgi:hypothetical protein